MKLKKVWKKALSVILSISMIAGPCMPSGAADVGTKNITSQIVVDYNTSIGTGSPMIFGGAGTPNVEDADAWTALTDTMGLKVLQVKVDLTKVFPNGSEIDTNGLEYYTHVAGGVLTKVRGTGMKAMITFENLPDWYKNSSDKAAAYAGMIGTFLNGAKAEYKDTISSVELTPDTELSPEEFSNCYYSAAQAVRNSLPNVQIGGMGYILTNKNDTLSENVKTTLTNYAAQTDPSLLQFVSVRGYGVNSTDGNANDIFGEFKAGRKIIRNQLNNVDMPLYLTGWSSVEQSAQTPNDTITGELGIKYHANALFKSMRDGWDMVLFDGTTSQKENPASYTYTKNSDGTISLNPFSNAYHLLSKKLGLGSGDFKVVSTDMGSTWPVDDSIAMMNSENQTILLMTNFNQAKSNITVEMKNVPYADGDVTLETYVASDAIDGNTAFSTISAKVVNGMINATIPVIPENCAMGVVIKGGISKKLSAQSMYEFESQDNHFGGNTEIGWTTGASFNRTVSGFGGDSNFVTLQKVQADGAGTYTAQLYGANGNANVKVSVNGQDFMDIDASGMSLQNPVSFDVALEAGSNNTIKVYTTSGELKPDRLVLTAKDVALSVGFQNLNTLEKEGEAYILPLAKKDFTVDARIFPEASSVGKHITYTSSAEDVATIDGNGLLTPLKTGQTTITAAVEEEPTVNNSFQLIVKNAVSAVAVSPKTMTLKPGETGKLTAALIPADAENKNISWVSSNPDLVKLTAQNNGEATITAIGNTGTVTVTATSEDGGKTDNCIVTVVQPVLGGDVTVDYGNTISAGSPYIFGVTHYPSVNKSDQDVGDHSVVWPMLKDEAGVRFMRADARLQEILPIWTKTPNTDWRAPASVDPGKPNYVMSDYYYVTGPDGEKSRFNLEGYQKDMAYYEEHGEYLNGMSNPDNWNTTRLMSWVTEAKKMGFKVMAMTFQIPEWLSAGEVPSGAPHTMKVVNGAPKDWTVYRDIIKKIYKMLREAGVDYYEFLNEPHWYVPTAGDQRDPSGTPYPTSNKVNLIAADQFYQAIDAIYEAEAELTGNANAKPTMQLGGGADDSWGGDYGVLGTILSDKYADWSQRIDFVSIHKYGDRPANQDDGNGGANSRNLKYWLRQKTGKNIPLFLNEYNISTGQPTDETYGYKSVGWHGKNLVDLMIDGYTGGGYYTCYPADVPMDDYEASSGWIERGKGMYTWNNGAPYLANFTKVWDLLSIKLGLGDGEYDVKSTIINGSMSQAIGAINTNGKPVAFVNNYSAKAYDEVKVHMNNLPYAPGSTVTASIYPMTYKTEIDAQPIVQEITVASDCTAVVTIPSIEAYGAAGIVVDGTAEKKADSIYEFESYKNTLNGQAKILKETTASNGRWVSQLEGEANAVTIPVQSNYAGKSIMELKYSCASDSTLTYIVEGQTAQTIKLPVTNDIESVKFTVNLPEKITNISFYGDNAELYLDALVKTEINKDALKLLVEESYSQEMYTDASWEIYVKAKAEAQKVLDNAQASTEEIEAAYNQLSEAIRGLTAVVDLEALIVQAEKKDAGQYTTETWVSFAVALSQAKKIAVDPTATQEDDIAAYKNLESAIDALNKIPAGSDNMLLGKKPISNTTITNPDEATDGNKNTSSENENSYAQLAAGEETGGADNGYSNWSDVYLQYDFGALYTVNSIDIYRTYYYNGDYIRWQDCKVELSTSSEFTPETTTVVFGPEMVRTEKFQAEPQEIVLDHPIQAQYIRVYGKGHIGSWGGYSNKVNFSEIEVYGNSQPNTDKLKEWIDHAGTLTAADYTSQTWNIMEEKLLAANKIYEKEAPTWNEINMASAELSIAIIGLITKADMTALGDKVAAMQELKKQAEWNQLTSEMQIKFNDIVTRAEALLADESSSQESINAMVTELTESITELKAMYSDIAKRAEAKKQLEQKLDELKKLDETQYTEQSFTELEKVIKSAEELLKKKDATAQEYQNMMEKLDRAFEGLEKKEPVKDPSILNATVSDITTEGYLVTADISAPAGLDRVSCETWTIAGDKDDITRENIAVKDGKISYAVKISDHNNESGSYHTEISVYDKNGKTATARVTAEVPASPNVSKISYSAHVQNIGWQDFVGNGEVSGTQSRGLRVEGIRIKLEDTIDGGIEYASQIQNIGWQDFVKDGEISGTEGRCLRLEAVQIRLTGKAAEKFDIYYRTHIQDYGWLGWTKNGERSGSQGLSKRLEAIEIRLIEKGGDAPEVTDNSFITPKVLNPTVSYQTHIQNIGWQKLVGDGELSGTMGRNLRAEGIKINLNNDGLAGNIQYRTHVQNIGWQDFVENGALAGTQNRSLRLEAIQIRLTGDMAVNYDIYYRTHIQDIGWLGWAKNGEASGTQGLSKRLEAIEIRLVKKGQKAPESAGNAYMIP